MSSQNSKYGKKSTFSREKSYANSELDIMRRDERMDEYKKSRSAERKHNTNVANGMSKTDKQTTGDNQKTTVMDNSLSDDSSTNDSFYYEKMNFIVNNLPAFYNLDSLVNEFSTYGKIQYITYSCRYEDGTNSAKLVVDKWYNCEEVASTFILDVQTAILKEGKYKWTSNDVGRGKMTITKDPDQLESEMGDKIWL
jgi:RNA recognition motif-containing protein